SRADQGSLARTHGLALRCRTDITTPICARPARGPRHRAGQPRLPVAGARVAVPSGRARRTADLVVAWSADGVLLGEPRAHRSAAPRDVVDQLDLPRDG